MFNLLFSLEYDLEPLLKMNYILHHDKIPLELN